MRRFHGMDRTSSVLEKVAMILAFGRPAEAKHVPIANHITKLEFRGGHTQICGCPFQIGFCQINRTPARAALGATRLTSETLQLMPLLIAKYLSNSNQYRHNALVSATYSLEAAIRTRPNYKTLLFRCRRCERSDRLSDMKTSTTPRAYVLSRSIPAIPLLPSPSGQTICGAICKLPAGVTVQLCGDGFNPSTVKVNWERGACFVFLQDLRA